MATYAEKLLDPRWQKKRLEVMQEKDFCCEICGNSNETLHVHHKEYLKGRDPWDYEQDQLAVICKDCHSMQHENEDLLKFVCSYVPLDGPGSREEIAFIIAGHIGLPLDVVYKKSGRNEFPWLTNAYKAGWGLIERLIQGDGIN